MGINIPDMVQIIKEHGLIPIPIDYDLNTMHPKDTNDIKLAINDKVIFCTLFFKQTKCVLFAYLFGIIYDISEIATYCRERNIDVLEDCAQSFCGPARFTGNSNATLTMFSFGAIKIQTSIYGGVNIIRDEPLYDKMRAV